MKEKKALILIAHGSRVKQTSEEMNALVQQLEQKCTDFLVEGAFMELQKPDIFTVAEGLVEHGVSQIWVLPLFIFEGRHMREDIPQQVEDCRQRHEGCKFELLGHVGSSDFFINSLFSLLTSL